MMNTITLTCGKPYPVPVAVHEGAVAQFLIRPGNFLQIVLPGMSDREQAALAAGLLVGGLLYEHGAMLLFFQFFLDEQPELTLSAPYNARLLSADNRILPDIVSPEQRLEFEIHALDGDNILKVIRQSAMPPAMTLTFFNCVQEQLTVPEKPGLMKGWLERKPDYLIKKSQAWVLGDS
jgi:hypothetical protein